ncbi:Endonuclease/exonuclease/phosphatase [Cubamyces menziesii]|nr:Endonuclease/exonuclease/phosphatase [Cubamyces menziesii]
MTGQVPRGQARSRFKNKAHLRIASLNIRGFGAGADHSQSPKWMKINQLVRENRIAILAVQETHLNRPRVDALDDLFGDLLVIEHSPDPTNPTGARGVAFVLNKRMIKTPRYTVKEVVPGRAILLDLQWTDARNVRILNVYGPNVPADNSRFWTDLQDADLGRIDLLLGDFNIVKRRIDRIPLRADDPNAVAALTSLATHLSVHDGWRSTHGDDKAFTYMHGSTTSQSRLDRIYIRNAIRKDADNWDIRETGVGTDHAMPFVDLADRRAPFVARGRWTMPKHLLKDQPMITTMRELATKLTSDLRAITERTASHNPQTVFARFKADLAAAAKARAKAKVPKMERRLEALRADRKATLDRLKNLEAAINVPSTKVHANGGSIADLHRHAAIMQERIADLETKRFEFARKAVAVNALTHGNSLTKKWIRANYTPPDFEEKAALEPMTARLPNTDKAKLARKLTKAEVC